MLHIAIYRYGTQIQKTKLVISKSDRAKDWISNSQLITHSLLFLKSHLGTSLEDISKSVPLSLQTCLCKYWDKAKMASIHTSPWK